MMRAGAVYAFCTVALAVLLAPLSSEGQRAVFVMRHAEVTVLPAPGDETADPPLSDAGQRRANALAGLLKDAGITAIYVTEYQRTVQTADPLARARQVVMSRLSRRESETLVDRLRDQHRQDTVLLVVNSSLVPVLLKALGHPLEVRIGREEWDNLFVVVPKGDGPPVVLRLHVQPGS